MKLLSLRSSDASATSPAFTPVTFTERIAMRRCVATLTGALLMLVPMLGLPSLASARPCSDVDNTCSAVVFSKNVSSGDSHVTVSVAFLATFAGRVDIQQYAETNRFGQHRKHISIKNGAGQDIHVLVKDRHHQVLADYHAKAAGKSFSKTIYRTTPTYTVELDGHSTRPFGLSVPSPPPPHYSPSPPTTVSPPASPDAPQSPSPPKPGPYQFHLVSTDHASIRTVNVSLGGAPVGQASIQQFAPTNHLGQHQKDLRIVDYNPGGNIHLVVNNTDYSVTGSSVCQDTTSPRDSFCHSIHYTISRWRVQIGSGINAPYHSAWLPIPNIP